MAVFFHNMYIFAPGILIAKAKIIPLIAIIGALLNLILNYAFIPSFGLLGAAYASLIVNKFILFYLFLSNKYYKLPYKYILQLVSFSIVLIFIRCYKYI